MPISEKHKAIFIHIPKNAGTSIINALEMERSYHRKITYYIENHNHEYNSYFKFAISRNPWDRVVSCYEYARSEKSYWHASEGNSIAGVHPDYEILKDMSFKDTVNLLIESPYTLKHPGWRLQSEFIISNGEIVLDEIYKAEELYKLEEKFDIKLPFLNKSRDDYSYKKYYNKKTAAIIKDIYKKDIELFNYNF
jgi:chondroitin 4-sulfotransferase 11